MQRQLERITAGDALSTSAARSTATSLVTDASTEQIAGLIAALQTKGVTEDELAGFALGLRDVATTIDPDASPLVDTCGTGGDDHDTINISTASAIVAAGAGAAVAKHGNTAVSSASGSADVLAELGVAVEAGASATEASITEHGIGFLHAQVFHPAMGAVAKPRAELGIRTIFNLVGPLTNPAGATRHVLGVYDPAAVDLVAGALTRLGVEHAMVVHGSGLDEIAVHGPTTVAEVRGDTVDRYSIEAADLGLETHPVEAIAGGTPAENAETIRALVDGEASDAVTAVVLANAGAACYVAGLADSLDAGVDLARQAIEDGAARRTLEGLVHGAITP